MGLATPDEALGLVARAGDHIWDAEWHRLKGELLLIQGAEESSSEACFRTVIAVAVGMVLQHLLDVGGVGREVGPPDPHWQRDHRPIAARRRGQVPERVAAQLREDAQGQKGPGARDGRMPTGVSHLSSNAAREPGLLVVRITSS
jgi:hypothetical protein